MTVPALPGCVTHGDDLDFARGNAPEAIECHLASMIKHGEPIPPDESVSSSVSPLPLAAALRKAIPAKIPWPRSRP